MDVFQVILKKIKHFSGEGKKKEFIYVAEDENGDKEKYRWCRLAVRVD
jgi:hypothetical protein